MRMRAADDFHCHLRQGPEAIVHARAAYEGGFSRIMAMPNTRPPITSPEGLAAYLAPLKAAIPALTVLGTFALHPRMRMADFSALKAVGAVAAKWYPAMATTNSDEGIADPDAAFPALADLEASGLILCIHAEDSAAPVFERERAFLPLLSRIAGSFPRLKLVFEHVSSAEGVEFVMGAREGVAGSLTPQHLLYTCDDMMGASLNPHLYCKPVVKFARDRDALREAAFSASPRFFLGTDSAPHPRAAKERAGAASGCYSAPVALGLVAGLFAEQGRLDRLESFASERGASFYGLPLNADRIELVEGDWPVPDEFQGFVPLGAGGRLRFLARRVAGDGEGEV
jgi:dihydroorotase